MHERAREVVDAQARDTRVEVRRRRVRISSERTVEARKRVRVLRFQQVERAHTHVCMHRERVEVDRVEEALTRKRQVAHTLVHDAAVKHVERQQLLGRAANDDLLSR